MFDGMPFILDEEVSDFSISLTIFFGAYATYLAEIPEIPVPAVPADPSGPRHGAVDDWSGFRR